MPQCSHSLDLGVSCNHASGGSEDSQPKVILKARFLHHERPCACDEECNYDLEGPEALVFSREPVDGAPV